MQTAKKQQMKGNKIIKNKGSNLLITYIVINFIDFDICIIISINPKSSMNFSSAKKNYDHEMPTAAKTNYQDFSPSKREFDTPSLKSPSRYSMKIQEARQSLSNIIGEVSSKKSMNSEAVERVRYTNKEALGLLYEDDDLSTYTPKRSYNDAPQRGYKTSQFLIPSSPKNYNDGYTRPINEFQIDDVPNTMSYSGPKNLQAENIELRRALNDQIRVNNELMQRIHELQEQNAELRRNAGYQQQSAAAFGSYSSPNNTGYWKQNNRADQVPSSIMRQLQELKRQNDMLRKDTISLLQNKKAVY